MKTLHLSIITISLLVLVTHDVNAQNGTVLEENMTISKHTAHMESPLKQFEAGITLQKIQCQDGLVLVIREGTGTPACLFQNDVAKLVYRHWAGIITPPIPTPQYRILGPYDGLQKQTGTITIQNKTFFMTTFNDTLNPVAGYQEIKFHEVNFTLFPVPQGLEISGREFYADTGFQDGQHEQLWLNPPIYSDMSHITITRLTLHTTPQAGIVSYDEQIKLLVSTDNQDNMSNNAEKEAINHAMHHKFPHPQDGFGCGKWTNATGWVKNPCVSPDIPHP